MTPSPRDPRAVIPSSRYREAGVDLDAADEAKRRIAQAVSSTYTANVLSRFGAFGGVVRIPSDVDRPAIVMSTDGVGTKVLVAAAARRHDTVGEDLVNHSVNDILVHGARPLAFLDYIGGSGLTATTIASIVEGVARGCRAHDMALAGGETAQLTDLYDRDSYDLVGTIIGVVSEAQELRADRASVGDVLVGYASSGLHTNGYTLARRILFEQLRLHADSVLPEFGMTVADVLLIVHRSYWRAIAPVIDRLSALAHITGGGIPGNLHRSLPPGVGARVERAAWSTPPVFGLLQRGGRVSREEMFRVFNMGIGMIAVAHPSRADEVRAAAQDAQVETWIIGELVSGDGVHLV